MKDRGTPVSREALYEEVWSDPATVVAPRCRLSDVGQVKACKRLRIPVPGRGYLAKVTAGRPTRKLPVPALAAGARTPSGPTPLSEVEAALLLMDTIQTCQASKFKMPRPTFIALCVAGMHGRRSSSPTLCAYPSFR